MTEPSRAPRAQRSVADTITLDKPTAHLVAEALVDWSERLAQTSVEEHTQRMNKAMVTYLRSCAQQISAQLDSA